MLLRTALEKVREYDFLLKVIATVIVFMIFMIYILNEQEKEWDVFSKEHECRVVGKISSDTVVAPTFTNGRAGMTVVTTPPKTGFFCNDGVTYWR